MKYERCRLLSFVLLFMLVVQLLSSTLYAGSAWGSLSDEMKSNATELWGYLTTAGYSEAAAAGILGNADQESSFTNLTSGSYKGYFQMSGDQFTAMKAWSQNNNLDSSKISVQFRYIEATCLERDFNTYTNMSLADYKATSDIIVGMEGFMMAYERCVGGEYAPQKVGYGPTIKKQYKYQDGDKRNSYASSCFEALTGSAPVVSDTSNNGGSSGGDSSSSSGGEILNITSGAYFTEQELSSFRALNEINVDAEFFVENTIKNLSQRGVESLSSWKSNIQDSKADSGYIKILRVGIMWIGIIFTLYIFMLYFAYWFDKVNSLIDIDLLGILTFQKLHVAMEESDVNFNLTNKQGKTYVNHRNILFICSFGFFFGAMIISGNFYKVISKLVNTILGILGV